MQSAPWHTVDGKHYGVPYQWGSNVLMYNTDVFPKAPTSWDVVFSEKTLDDGKSNKGRVQAFDGPIYIADAALYLKKRNPELGIDDPYALDEEQYQAALSLLREQRKIVNRYWHDPFIQIDDFTNEGVVASSAWPFQVNLLIAQGVRIADAALYLKKRKPELGIDDPYALDEEQYQAALSLLREQRKIVNRYWHDPFIQIDDFTNEGVVASSAWPFQVNLLIAQGQPIASVVPAEGATGWADTTMMHADAPHPNCAYMWLEHSINPKLQGDLAAWFGSVPVRLDACKGNALLGDNGCDVNGLGNFERTSFWKTPVAKCGGGRTCVPYYRWVTDYIAVLGGR